MVSWLRTSNKPKDTLLPEFLSVYRHADFLTKMKADFIFKVIIAMIVFLFILLLTTATIQMFLLKGLKPIVLSIEVLCLLSFVATTMVLKKGSLNTAIHMLMIISLSSIWIVILTDIDNYTLTRFDTIAFSYGVLSMTPLLTNNNKSNIFIYTGFNIVALSLFCFYILEYDKQIQLGEVVDFFIDNSIAYILTATVAYNIFLIYNKSIRRSEEATDTALAAELEVKQLNEELEAKVSLRTKELKEALNIIEVSNYELNILNENISEEAKKLVELNEKLFESEQKLRHANDTKDMFFSIIAHDLKNPFVSLINNSEMLEMYYEKMTDAERVKIISSLKNASKNTYTLLDNLLVWSRSQMGNMSFSPYKFVLNDLMLKIKLSISLQAEMKNIELLISIPDNFEVFADEDMLNTTVRNLATNAIKFTPRGGKVEIGIDPKYQRYEVCFFVKDSGIGIDDDTLRKLFSLDKKVSRPGTEGELSTGLGLILCKEFVEKHGGKIWVESEVGKGSTFYFTMPQIEKDIFV